MSLVDRSTSIKLEVPHEPGEWIGVRFLSGSECEELEERATKISMARLDDMNEKVLAAAPKFQEAKTGEDKPDDPADRFPRTATLRLAVLAWSYEETCTPDRVDELDNVTAEWLHEEVVKMNTRSVNEGEGSSGEPENTTSETDGSPQN